MKQYEVLFSIDGCASMIIDAPTEDDAEEAFLQTTEVDELMRRFKDALDFHGLKIDMILELDDE